jgi:hypothetical protein
MCACRERKPSLDFPVRMNFSESDFVDADRLSNILELPISQIVELMISSPGNLIKRSTGNANSAWLSDFL